MSIKSVVASGRRLIATTLLDRALIQDRTLVPDSTGGKKEVFTERTKKTSCRFVTPKEDDPILNVDSVFGPTTMVLLLPLGSVFHEGDRIRDLFDDSVYVITKDVTVPSNMGVVMKAGIREVD